MVFLRRQIKEGNLRRVDPVQTIWNFGFESFLFHRHAGGGGHVAGRYRREGGHLGQEGKGHYRLVAVGLASTSGRGVINAKIHVD